MATILLQKEWSNKTRLLLPVMAIMCVQPDCISMTIPSNKVVGMI